MKPKRKPTCTYYQNGYGICYKGDSCDFCHSDTHRSSLEIETAGDPRFTFDHLIRSLVGGDDDKASNAFLNLLNDYLNSKINVRMFLLSAEKANLSHILPDVARSLKVTNRQTYTELSSAIDRSVKEKERLKEEQEKRKKETQEKEESAKRLKEEIEKRRGESFKKLCSASEEKKKKLIQRRKERTKTFLSFDDQEDGDESVDEASSSSFSEKKCGKHVRHKESEDRKPPQRRRAELEDPVENIGAILVSEATAKTNALDTLAQGFIDEGLKVVAARANPLLITRGIEKTAKALVAELKKISKEVEDSELGSVAAVSAGNDPEIGNIIGEAVSRVGRKGVVILEEGKNAENALYVVEGLEFDRGYLSPCFVTDWEKMSVEFNHCKLLLVEKKITNIEDIVGVVEDAIRGAYPVLIVAEDIEMEVLAILVDYKRRGTLNIAAVKAPGFGELADIAILTGATVVREKFGHKSGNEVLGHASKVFLTKKTSTIVGDGSTHEAVQKHLTQIKNLIEQAEQGYEKEKLNERLAKLSGGVAVIQLGAQTETKLKEKRVRVEDALNATKAAVEEGIVVGGGSILLHLASKVDVFKDSLDNDEEKVGADIVKRGLTCPLKRISKNAGEKVLSNEDLMVSGNIYPTKVVRGCLENAVKMLKTLLMSHQGA